ncbi:MAG: long-chain fatty acid--CoA ligase [Rikenellaceae bacterium]|nr:long-chain fatty acid--CoA ligase [Rikenellaceae bacterium]
MVHHLSILKKNFLRHYLTILQTAIRRKWNEPALSDYKGDVFTFADIATRISKLHFVFDRLGVKPGDKVALASKNSARWATSFMAAATYRAVAVPILNDFTPEAISGLVNHSESVVLFTDSATWEAMPKELPNLLAVIDVDTFTSLYSKNGKLVELIAESEATMPAVYPESMKEAVTNYVFGDIDDLAIINYTSGTTSSPKGVMLTARNISANIEFALSRIPIQDGDRTLSMLPMAHMYGMAFEFIYPLCGGGHITFLGKTPTPTILMQALADVKPYILITVPLVLEKIFKGKVMPTLQKPALRVLTAIPGVRNLIYKKVRTQLMTVFGGNLRSIVLGGAALSRPVEEVVKKIGLPYTVGYGMTECAPLIGYSPWESFRLGSCGRATDNVEVRIDSEDAQRKVGEIQVRGDNVMQGYYKNPEATAAAFTEDGWLRTGDLGIIDKKGNIFIKGRSKCMILSANGQNIYPEEIESLLNAMPHVGESLIVDRGHTLVALVALTPDDQKADREEVKAALEFNRVELNKVLPNYSQVAKIEIQEGGFEHTPKQSIKRFMYK